MKKMIRKISAMTVAAMLMFGTGATVYADSTIGDKGSHRQITSDQDRRRNSNDQRRGTQSNGSQRCRR